MSPSVATRIVVDKASVETPRSAATCRRGTICNSGRSSSAVEIGFSSIGIERISLAIWLAVSLISLMSGPAMISWRSRWPLSLRNQKRMSGLSARISPIRSLQVLLRRRALRFVDEIDYEGRLARLVVRAAEELAAEDERRAHLGHRAQLVGDRAGYAVGVFEPGARRQFDRQQRAAGSSAGMKPDGSSCVDQSEPAKISAPTKASPSASARSRARAGCRSA